MRFLILAGAVLLGIAITVLSIIPVNRDVLGTRTRSVSAVEVRKAARRHVAVHIIIFGTLAAAAWFLSRSLPGKLTALLPVLLLGIGTEYLQHHIYGAPLEVDDVRTNALSSGAVFAVLTLIGALIRRPPRQTMTGVGR